MKRQQTVKRAVLSVVTALGVAISGTLAIPKASADDPIPPQEHRGVARAARVFIGNVFRARHIIITSDLNRADRYFENNTFVAGSITIRSNGTVSLGDNTFITGNLTVESGDFIHGEVIRLERSVAHLLGDVEPKDVEQWVRLNRDPNDLRKRGIWPSEPPSVGMLWFQVLDTEGPVREVPDFQVERHNVFAATKSPIPEHAEAARNLAQNKFANFDAIQSVSGRMDGYIHYTEIVAFATRLTLCRIKMEEARRDHGSIAGVMRFFHCSHQEV
jgi:hypothetical protein